MTPVRSAGDLLHLVREVAGRGCRLCVVNDFDDTLSLKGRDGGADPTESVLHPRSAKALARLAAHGADVGIISNRSTAQIARRLDAAGVTARAIVGTYGWELFRADPGAAGGGHVSVDARFQPYRETISAVLQRIRTQLCAAVGLPDAAGDATDITLPTIDGPIILERKGVCPGFPEGLAHVYNFNRVPPTPRTHLAALLAEQFRASAGELDILHDVWGMAAEAGQPERPGPFSLYFAPSAAKGKAYGLVTLLRAISAAQPTSPGVGLVLYGGDHDADAAAMEAAKRLESVTHGTVRAVGIWVKAATDQPLVRQRCDISVDGVDVYAEVLSSVAAAVMESQIMPESRAL